MPDEQALGLGATLVENHTALLCVAPSTVPINSSPQRPALSHLEALLQQDGLVAQPPGRLLHALGVGGPLLLDVRGTALQLRQQARHALPQVVMLHLQGTGGQAVGWVGGGWCLGGRVVGPHAGGVAGRGEAWRPGEGGVCAERSWEHGSRAHGGQQANHC